MFPYRVLLEELFFVFIVTKLPNFLLASGASSKRNRSGVKPGKRGLGFFSI
jgi:hypothetical protein